MATPKRNTLDVYRFFFTAYTRRSVLMVLLMILAGLAEGVGVVTLVPVLEFADRSSGDTSQLGEFVLNVIRSLHLEPTIGFLLTLIVLAITAKAIFLFFAQRQVGFTVAGVVRDLRLRFMRSLLEVEWGYFGKTPPGRFAASVSSEAVRASTAYTEACRIIAAVTQMLTYAIIAALVSWWIALGGALTGISLTLLVRRFFRRTREAGEAQTVAGKNLSSRLVDVLQGIKPIKAMGREGLVWPLLAHETEALNLAKRSEVVASQSVKAFQEPMLTLFLAVGLYLVLEVAGQPLTSTVLMAFIFYRLVAHFNTLQMRYQLVLAGESAFFSFQEEWEAAAERKEGRGGPVIVKGLHEGIRLEDVHFSYEDVPVLGGANAFFPAGSFVAIHGESGSGKTTLADLIVGLHRPQAGQILVDGTPLEELDLASWRRAIGYVPQEMLLFTESVLNNVTLGDPAFSRKDAEDALKLAGAWNFVEEKKLGLDHPMGHGGSLLSGGQRQRIALARALVGRPSLLILDEVTTALDPKTELEICKTLTTLVGKVTILSISHQAAMREAADLVFVMKKGQLINLEGAVSPTA